MHDYGEAPAGRTHWSWATSQKGQEASPPTAQTCAQHLVKPVPLEVMPRFTISNDAWKLSLALLAILALVEIGFQLVHSRNLLGPTESGNLRAQLHPLGILRFRTFVIDQFEGESPLSKAGAQIGDSIKFDSAIDVHGTTHPGEAVGLTLFHGASSRHLTLQSAPYNAPSDGGLEWLEVVYSAVGLALALIIGFKRPESISCRALSFFFVMTVFNVFALTSAPGFYNVLGLAAWALTIWLFWASLVIFSIYFPNDQPEGLRQKYARRLPYLLLFVLLATPIIFANRVLGLYLGPHFVVIPATLVLIHLIIVISSLFDGLTAANRELKQRQSWVLFSFSIYTVLTLGTWITHIVASEQTQVLWNWVWLIGALVVYSGLIYAVLRYRVFNFGFALNRAVIYSVTSILLLVSFGIIEWLSEHVLQFESREKNILLDGGIALAVFLGFHRGRRVVESFIERVLFYPWHHNEETLRQFVRRAAHITAREALLTAFGGELDRFTKNAGHAIYQMGHEGQFDLANQSLPDVPARVDVDDGVAVALRAEAAPIQVADIDTVLNGEWALPMVHRGNLNGFVLLGNKSNNETYRPDEIDVLGFATHQLALDLVALRVEQLEQYSSDIKHESQIREHEAAVLRDQLKAAMQLLKSTDVVPTR